MASVQSKEQLKSYFESGDKPKQAEFENLIESMLSAYEHAHLLDDSHVKNYDDFLAYGTANQVSAAQLKALLNQIGKLLIVDAITTEEIPAYRTSNGQSLSGTAPGPLTISGKTYGLGSIILWKDGAANRLGVYKVVIAGDAEAVWYMDRLEGYTSDQVLHGLLVSSVGNLPAKLFKLSVNGITKDIYRSTTPTTLYVNSANGVLVTDLTAGDSVEIPEAGDPEFDSIAKLTAKIPNSGAALTTADVTEVAYGSTDSVGTGISLDGSVFTLGKGTKKYTIEGSITLSDNPPVSDGTERAEIHIYTDRNETPGDLANLEKIYEVPIVRKSSGASTPFTYNFSYTDFFADGTKVKVAVKKAAGARVGLYASSNDDYVCVSCDLIQARIDGETLTSGGSLDAVESTSNTIKFDKNTLFVHGSKDSPLSGTLVLDFTNWKQNALARVWFTGAFNYPVGLVKTEDMTEYKAEKTNMLYIAPVADGLAYLSVMREVELAVLSLNIEGTNTQNWTAVYDFNPDDGLVVNSVIYTWTNLGGDVLAVGSAYNTLDVSGEDEVKIRVDINATVDGVTSDYAAETDFIEVPEVSLGANVVVNGDFASDSNSDGTPDNFSKSANFNASIETGKGMSTNHVLLETTDTDLHWFSMSGDLLPFDTPGVLSFEYYCDQAIKVVGGGSGILQTYPDNQDIVLTQRPYDSNTTPLIFSADAYISSGANRRIQFELRSPFNTISAELKIAIANLKFEPYA